VRQALKLTDEEQAMRGGEFGPLRQWAIAHQIEVGSYLGAADFVPVTQAHIMADTESLGRAGVAWLERWAALPMAQRQMRVPTITDPRGTDFAHAERLKQQPWMLDLERRAIAAFEALGVLMTDTCINYQTIMPPVRGEHVAYGDTGVVIYCNSVCGARSNFEGGPSALSAGLTGRTPRYGYHLEAARRASVVVEVSVTPRELSDWGALGGIIGRLAGDYWQVPALVGLDRVPGPDELKHFGAALASFGSVALFHIAGVTPEAMRLGDVIAAEADLPTHAIGEADLRAFAARYAKDIGKVDVVVFSAPQLSLLEMQTLAGLLDGRDVAIPLFAVTSPQVKPDCDRLGLTARIESAGGTVLSGMCFYQSYAREMAEANGWHRLATNSAKLVNIIGGYGYRPVLLPMEQCVDAACAGGKLRAGAA
jgi:predicted aconitase